VVLNNCVVGSITWCWSHWNPSYTDRHCKGYRLESGNNSI